MYDKWEWICIWCGKESGDRSKGWILCSAPDGDGHLFKRKLIEEKNNESNM